MGVEGAGNSDKVSVAKWSGTVSESLDRQEAVTRCKMGRGGTCGQSGERSSVPSPACAGASFSAHLGRTTKT